MATLTITTTCSVGPDGPEETVWVSLDGEKFLPVTGCEDWREWRTAPQGFVEAVAELLEPEHDPVKDVTRYKIAWARRILAMNDCEFTTMDIQEGL